MSGRWGGRASDYAGARDFQVGALSSKELEQFKQLPRMAQAQITSLLEKIRYWQGKDSTKAAAYAQQLKALEQRLGL
jgi:hypothetical protein